MSLRSLWIGLRRLAKQDAAERELSDEVSHYLEMATRVHMRRGLTRDQAERAARVAFGGVEVAKEMVRNGGWEAAIATLWQDVRYALRGLRRNVVFTVVAVLTLALGIGANTAMFSIVSAVNLRPLPYRDPSRLVLLWTDDTRRGLHEEATAYRTIADWRTDNHTFADMAFFNTQRAVLSGGDARERTQSAFVSGNLFAVLGVTPVVGHTIDADDEVQHRSVAVISYGLWQRRFGGDARIVGRPLDVEQMDKGGGASPTIVGVMPPDFYFPDKQTDFWTTATTYWRWNREQVERFPDWARRWTVIGRLRRDVTLAKARSDLAAVGKQLSATYPSTVPDFPGFTPTVVPVLDHVASRSLQTALWILLGAVSLVLLVACANVANLLLARGASRHQEFAIRRALGAGRARLVRQLLVESAMLAAVGGAAGVLIAVLATRAFGLAAAARLPRGDEVTISGSVLAFAVVASVTAGIVFGIAPAFRASGVNPGESLKEAGRPVGGRAQRRTRDLLVVVECSLAIVLLAGAGLLLRSLERLRAVDPGFSADGVLSMRLELPRIPPPEGPRGAYPAPMERGYGEQLLNDLSGRIVTLPGVRGVSFADDIFVRGDADESITIPGRPTNELAAGQLYSSSATPGFLELMRVPLRRGRYLTRDDAFTKIRALYFKGNTDWSLVEKERFGIHEPVVVNEAFVKRFFPAEDPIGKTFCIDPTNKTYWYVIVGVVGDMRRQGLERGAIPEYFGTFLPATTAELLVRTRGDPLSVAPAVRGQVTSALPGTIVLGVTTADRRLDDYAAQRRFQTLLLTMFAALALGLAVVGVYGVVQYGVAERTREIGVRLALGATPHDVLTLVISQGVRWPLIGIAIGLAGALALTRLMTHLLFGVAPTDPLTFVLVAVTLAAGASLACYLPARGATRVDPVAALRRE